MENNWKASDIHPLSVRSTAYCSSKPLTIRHKSTLSLHSINSEPILKEISTTNDTHQLERKLNALISENSALKAKICQIKAYFNKEIRNRDEVILSVTNLMKEREATFEKLFYKIKLYSFLFWH